MTEWYWLLMMMVTLHVFADFHLQGILANMKQREWWYHSIQDAVVDSERRHNRGADLDSKEASAFVDMRMKMYGKDYIAALWLHAFEWSFIVCIPLMWFVEMNWVGAALVLLNTVLHAYIDDLKCNQMEISLVTDQCCHLVQILCTLALWTVYAGV